ncbi:MAG: glycosyltransferase [Kiritimatiellae bacterium]|jgi:glycosyltransferase involved in cell wall biosynthesis|nr:glycosyltransferase [Kiritimatiellia bacterium]
MNFSIYIPVFNRRDELKRTLRALIPEKASHEIFVVDLGSTDGSQDLLKEYPWAQLLTPIANLRSKALNEAAQSGEGEVLFFLEPGTLPARGWAQALETHFSNAADAGHFTCREVDSTAPWAANLRALATKLGQQILGGPASLNGVAVKRETFEKVEGFRPVPDFEWLAFAARLKQSGAVVKPIKHEVLMAPAPGSRQRNAWFDLKEDLQAAMRYRKTEDFDLTRCKRKASAAILFGYDAFPVSDGNDYMAYARQEVLKLALEKMQSYRGVEKIYYIGGTESTKLIGQPSGVEVIGKPRSTVQKRYAELLDRIRNTQPEGLLLVRGISNALTHESLRNLCEGPSEAPCVILPETGSGEWLALWLEGPALDVIPDWELSPEVESLTPVFNPKAIRKDIEAGLPALRTDSDARALYYSGLLDHLPA